MLRPLVLYSTNTLLSFAIAERFYGGVHYAWCSPVFDRKAAAMHINIPPTSSPAAIYRQLWEETSRGEMHSDAILRIREGIAGGAHAKLAGGVIDAAQHEEIMKMISRATTREFRPVLYIIPYDRVEPLVADVPVEERAHPLSIEYKITALPRDCFDPLELWS
jgi:hypothetical protein